MEKAWFMARMEKELRPQWNITSWFYEMLFSQVAIFMVKVKKRYTIKDAKIQCQSTLVLCITGITSSEQEKSYLQFSRILYGLCFWAPFFFSLLSPIGKRSALSPSRPMVSTGLQLFK